MLRTTIFLSKFVGTISLGLLTGVSYTVSTAVVPPLLLVSAASPAHQTFQQIRSLTSRHQRLLSTAATSSFVIAYILSPPRFRHPYLLWSALTVGLGFWHEAIGLWRGKSSAATQNEIEEWEVEGVNNANGEVNGEVVRDGMEAWRGRQVVRSAVWGVGWVMAIVGMWGDVI